MPKEYGGAGLTLAHEKIWREVKGHYPMPDSEFIISHGMCMPMLAEYGVRSVTPGRSLAETYLKQTHQTKETST